MVIKGHFSENLRTTAKDVFGILRMSLSPETVETPVLPTVV